MKKLKGTVVDSPIGKQKIDNEGSPVGVARVDAFLSYAGTGELLQKYIAGSDHDAWNKIKAKIDHTYQGLKLALSALEHETGFAL
jgi:hypothetical protein